MLFIKKVVDYFIWAIFILFFLLGIILYIFNQAKPGNYFYPFKQSFGNFIFSFK